MPKVHGWSTISGRFLKCGSVHTLMAKIAHNPLRFDFGSELQTRIKRVRKTTNVADARDRPLDMLRSSPPGTFVLTVDRCYYYVGCVQVTLFGTRWRFNFST